MIEIYKNELVEYKTRESAGFMVRACQYCWRFRMPMIGDGWKRQLNEQSYAGFFF